MNGLKLKKSKESNNTYAGSDQEDGDGSIPVPG